jgi:hypothetical protein
MPIRHVVLPAVLGMLICSLARADGPTALQLQAQMAAGPTAPAANAERMRATSSESAISTIATSALSVANQAIASQGGDGSKAVVTAAQGGSVRTGAVARSLAARFGTTIDERDFGALCNGTTDDTAAFQAAQLAAQALGGATIQLGGAGTCKLQTVYTVSNNGWEFGSNLHLNGTVSGVLDDISHARRTIAFQTANDFGESNLFLSQEDLASSGTTAYQKNGVYVRLFQLDPSTYNGTINNVDQVGPNKDAVAYEAQIDIRPGNMFGRIYGYHAQASADSGSDGNINVGEFELANNGTYTPQPARFNTKRVLHVTCIGTVDCTDGVDIDGFSRFHIALTAYQSAIRTDGYFLYLAQTGSADLTLPPVFGVSQSGQITTSGGAAVTGGLSTDSLSVSGLTARSARDAVSAAVITTPSTGTAPSGATTLATSVIRATGCASGSAFQLPAGAAAGLSVEIVVLNRSGAACTVYPPAGGTIESNAANVAVTVPAGADQAFRSMSPSSWFQ